MGLSFDLRKKCEEDEGKGLSSRGLSWAPPSTDDVDEADVNAFIEEEEEGTVGKGKKKRDKWR